MPKATVNDQVSHSHAGDVPLSQARSSTGWCYRCEAEVPARNWCLACGGCLEKPGHCECQAADQGVVEICGVTIQD